MVWILGKLAIRLVAFIAVFWLFARKDSRIRIKPRWALPIVAGVFALFNAGLYWMLRPVVELATFGALAMLIPLALNGVFLWATAKAVAKKQWLVLDGVLAPLWLTLALTLTHGALHAALEWLPARYL